MTDAFSVDGDGNSYIANTLGVGTDNAPTYPGTIILPVEGDSWGGFIAFGTPSTESPTAPSTEGGLISTEYFAGNCVGIWAPTADAEYPLFCLVVEDANDEIVWGIKALDPYKGVQYTAAPNASEVAANFDTFELNNLYTSPVDYDVNMTVYLAIIDNNDLEIQLGVGSGTLTYQTLLSGSTYTGILPVTFKIPASTGLGYAGGVAATQYEIQTSGTGTVSVAGQWVEAA